MTKKEIATKFELSIPGVDYILNTNNIQMIEKRGKCHLYDKKTIEQYFTFFDKKSKKGEISTSEIVKKYGIKRNIVLQLLVDRGINPIRRLDKYRGMCFFDLKIIEIVMNDYKNGASNYFYSISKKDMISSVDLSKILGLNIDNVKQWVKKHKIKSIEIKGSRCCFYSRLDIMPKVNEYLNDKKIYINLVNNKELITRKEIEYLLGVTRQRIQQIVKKLKIKPVAELHLFRAAYFFYNRTDVYKKIPRLLKTNNLQSLSK